MIRTGDQYRSSIRDGREVYIDGARVKDKADEKAQEKAKGLWSRGPKRRRAVDRPNPTRARVPTIAALQPA